MRFSSRGLDDGFTYPCTKADVREAFGDDRLDSASFGLRTHYSFPRSEVAGEITGKVLLTLGISTIRWPREEEVRPRASLYGYRVRREEWSGYLRWQLRETMRTKMRPWTEVMLARPEIAWGPYEQMFLELREGVLHLHTRRAK